jgi:hypothetical protein
MKLPVSVPEVVTGEPEILNTEAGSAKPTDVTVPPASVLEIVIVLTPGVIFIPVPGTRVSAPVKLLRLVTPLPPPPLPILGPRSVVPEIATVIP